MRREVGPLSGRNNKISTAKDPEVRVACECKLLKMRHLSNLKGNVIKYSDSRCRGIKKRAGNLDDMMMFAFSNPILLMAQGEKVEARYFEKAKNLSIHQLESNRRS